MYFEVCSAFLAGSARQDYPSGLRASRPRAAHPQLLHSLAVGFIASVRSMLHCEAGGIGEVASVARDHSYIKVPKSFSGKVTHINLFKFCLRLVSVRYTRSACSCGDVHCSRAVCALRNAVTQRCQACWDHMHMETFILHGSWKFYMDGRIATHQGKRNGLPRTSHNIAPAPPHAENLRYRFCMLILLYVCM
jgi:hypothetical protein